MTIQTIDPSWKKFEMPFGKYKGESMYDIYIENSQYISWIAKTFDDGKIKTAAIAIMANEPMEIEKTNNNTVTLDFNGKIIITSPFEAKDICTSLSIREWDGKNWSCPSMIIKEIIEVFSNSEFKIHTTRAFENEINKVEVIKTTSTAIDSDFIMADEFGGNKTLYPYQCAGAKFLEISNGNGMINDTVGLGKSAQALSYIYNNPEMRPVIIVCPSSIKYQWQEYCQDWMPESNPVVLESGKKPDMTGDIIILNYDIAKKYLKNLQEINPQIIILDESHKVKNYKSQRTKAIVTLTNQIPHKILLSGTPALNRPSELWQQLAIVRPDIYNRMYFTEWHKKYCDAKQNRYGWDYSGSSNVDKLAEELKNIMIRRTEEEVFSDLPEMIRSTVPITITNRRIYNSARKDYIAWVRDQKGLVESKKASRAEHLSRISALKKLVADGKLKASIEWIKDYLETEDKIVVFAHHKSIIVALADEFKNECVVIDGSTPQKDRTDIAAQFESNPKIKMIIGNIKAMSEGINLGVSKTVLTLEFDWSPKTHEQCEGRIKGLRQMGRGRKFTRSYYLAGIDTVDIEIINMLESKRKVIDGVMDDDTKLDFDFLAGLVK